MLTRRKTRAAQVFPKFRKAALLSDGSDVPSSGQIVIAERHHLVFAVLGSTKNDLDVEPIECLSGFW